MNFGGKTGKRPRAGRAAIAALMMTTGMVVATMAVPAHAQEAARTFDISAQPLANALTAFGQQSGLQVSAQGPLVEGRTSSAVRGTMPPLQALSQMLAGTGLTFRIVGSTVTLAAAPVSSDGAIQLGAVRVAGGGGGGGSRAISSDPDTTENSGSYKPATSATASRMPLTIRETPQSVTVVTRQRMDDFQLLTIDSVLTSVVGVNALTTESSRNNFISRGFLISNFRVDGIDANYLGSVSGGRTPSIAFDTYLYDRIEVVRGATGLLSPTGDPSATVNMVRKRPGTEFAVGGTAAIGNRDFVRGGVDLNLPITSDGKLRARLVGVYQRDDSWRDRASDERFSLFANVELDATDTTLVRLTGSYEVLNTDGPSYGSLPVYNTARQFVNLPRSTNFATTWSKWDKNEFRTDLTVEQRIGDDWTITGFVGRTVAESNPYLAFLGDQVPNAAGNGRRYFTYINEGTRSQWTYDVSLRGSFELFGREHMLVLGANGLRQRDRREAPNYNLVTLPFINSLGSPNIYGFTGVAPRFPDYTADTFTTTKVNMDGAFGSLRLSIADPLHIILGGRVTDWRTSNEALTPGVRNFTENKPGRVFTPFAGATWDILPQLTAYVSYADVFTPQTQRTISDDVIDPIVGSNIEAGLKAELFDERLAINAAVFEAKLDNVAQMIVPVVPLPSGGNAYESTGKGNKTRGWEIEVNGAITDRWNIYAGYSYNNTKNAAGVRTSTERPRDSFKLQTMWRVPAFDDRLSLGGGVSWQGETYLTPTVSGSPLRVTQEGYALVSLAATYRVNDAISVNLNANNLFDEVYYTYPGFGYFGEPRTVRMTVTGKF